MWPMSRRRGGWDDGRQKSRIDEAISRLFECSSGRGFDCGLPPRGGSLLSAYALDFATRPGEDLSRAAPPKRPACNGWRTGQAGDRQKTPDLAGLALCPLLLAAAGVGNPAEIRYFAERTAERQPTALAGEQVAAGLAMRGRAERSRCCSPRRVQNVNARSAAHDYVSTLRDLAASSS
jgi:hypothetical protein